MTLRVAAFQHFCGRFADALLTSFSPLTYERGDYLTAFEEENEVHEPDDDGTKKKAYSYRGCIFPPPTPPPSDSPVGVSTSPPTVPPTGLDPSPTIIESAPPPQVGGDGTKDPGAAPPAASVTPAPVDGTPPASPGAGLSFVDYMTPAICDVLADHMPYGDDGDIYCQCEPLQDLADEQDWREHVAPLIAGRIERSGGKR